MPALCRLKSKAAVYSIVNTAQQLKEGMGVKIWAGYNGRNSLVFEGYISRIGYSIPLQIECECYSYLLRRNTFNASYRNATVRQVLLDAIKGTPILLHPATVDVNMGATRFNGNANALQVLDWLKRNMMRVYFVGNKLYAGIEMLPVTGTVRYRLNYNTVSDNNLHFGPKPPVTINISPELKASNGTRKRGGHDAPGKKVKRVALQYTQAQLDKVAHEANKQQELKGFEGTLEAFLEPMAQVGMAADIEDTRYPERNGKYFIEAIEGSLSQSGGRLNIKLGGRL